MDEGRLQEPSILVVAQDHPWPVVTGSMIRLTSVLSALAELGHVDLFAFVHEQREDPVPAPDSVPVRRVATATYHEAGFGVGRRARWLMGRPILVASRDWDECREQFATWAEKRYDLVWFSKAHTFEVLGRPRLGPTIVDLDDLEDHKILAALTARRAGGPRSVVRRRLADTQQRLDAAHWTRLQARIAASVDAVVVCSELDRVRSGLANATIVPNGYERPPAPVGRSTPGNAPTVLLAGLLFYPPNSDAATWLVRAVLPRLRELVPDVQIRLVGAPDPAVRALAEIPAVTVTGRVPAMEPELARADLVAVPVRFGSGTRVKILEAFAHGIPVVSTTLGAEGLDAHDGEHLLLADDPHAFAEACARVLGDIDLANQLVRRAQKLYATRHTTDATKSAVENLGRALLAAHTRTKA